MPVTWTFDSANQFVQLTLAGAFTFKEWRDAVEEVLATRSGPQRILADTRPGRIPSVPFVSEVVNFTRTRAAALAGWRVAILADNEATFGIARMTELRTQVAEVDIVIRVFMAAEDALQWLTAERTRATH